MFSISQQLSRVFLSFDSAKWCTQTWLPASRRCLSGCLYIHSVKSEGLVLWLDRCSIGFLIWNATRTGYKSEHTSETSLETFDSSARSRKCRGFWTAGWKWRRSPELRWWHCSNRTKPRYSWQIAGLVTGHWCNWWSCPEGTRNMQLVQFHPGLGIAS